VNKMTKEEFITTWDTKIKPFAVECCNINEPKDTLAKEYIGDMIFAVEHDIADGRVLGLMGLNCILQINGCLNDGDYYKNVHSDVDNTETNKLKALGRLLKEGIKILTDTKGV